MASILPQGRLAYGMQLPIQAQSALYAEAWEREAGPAELLAIAQQADASGFLYLGVCDHIAIPAPLDERMGATWYDTLTTLGYLAGRTEHVRLLSHVLVLPYRHPLVVAKGFMTLDRLSGGRALLGVGAGHVEAEFNLLGVDFAGRGRAADACLDGIRAALDDPAAAGGAMAPRPVQERLPIWVGGSSRAALRRAAIRGDGWLPQGTPRSELPGQIAYLKEQRELARGADPIDIGANAETLYLGQPRWDVGSGTLTGSPEEVAESLRGFAEMGVGHVQLRFRSRSADELLAQIEAFGAEVAPLL